MAQTIVLRNNPAYKEGSLLGYDLNSQSRYNPVPITLSRDSEAYVEKNGVLTRVNPEVPRIDSDGALLVEPQRTNFMLSSEDIAGWTAISGLGTTANNQTAPDGATTADTITGDGTSTACRLNQTVSVSAGGQHIFSCFLKAGTNNFAAIDVSGFVGGSGTSIFYFDLVNGTTPTAGAKIDLIGNGWYYCQSAPFTVDSGDLAGNMSIYITRSDTIRDFAAAGDANGQSVYAWGAQVEAGSYATSYIKTEGATATRSADVVSQTGLANLLGDAEGTLYVEMQAFADYSANSSISLNDSSVLNTVRIRFSSSNNIEGGNLLSGATQSQITTSGVDIKTINKCAFRYSLNDFAFYVNGSQIGTDVSGGVYSDGTLTDLSFDRGGGGEPFYGKLKALAVYDTALDNSELANITTNGI